MKTSIVALLLLAFLCTGTAWAADQPKVSLSAQDTPIKDVCASITQQTGASIVLDPKATGSVTINLNNMDLSQVLDTVTKLNNLTWRKLQFAKPTDDSVKLDQIKSAMVALAAMPMVALAVEDSAAQTTSVFAKGLPASAAPTQMKLPEGYEWTTCYVVLSPDSLVAARPASTSSAGGAQDAASVTQNARQNIADIARLTPEERQRVYQDEIQAQLSLDPEVRRQMWQDRRQAMRNLPQEVRDQMRQQGIGFGDRGNRPGGGTRRNRDGARNTN